MKKRFPALVLALLFALALTVPCAQTASAAQKDYIAAEHTYSNGKPYYIMVNRAQNTVTVYGLDAKGYYTVPVKAMICSIGRKGSETPLGTFTLGGQWLWIHMLDDSYGQYVSQISGNILFHSVCYNQKDPSTLITEEYNGLGAPASLGCVRLQTSDAKWIYDNCAKGTKITIYDGTTPGALGKPDRLVNYIAPDHPASNWDPTDPRAENPWPAILDATQGSKGNYYDIPIAWAVVNGIYKGNGSSATAPDTVLTRAQVLTMLWRAAGEPASTYQSSIPGDEYAWYAGALHWAAEKGMIDRSFRPNAVCTRANAVKYIWHAFNRPTAKTAAGFTDVSAVADFSIAVDWAAEKGIVSGAGTSFFPYGDCTQAQILTLLYRAYRK